MSSGSGDAFSRRDWIALAAVLLLLDASLTFHNVWPTLRVGWSGQISIELVALIAGFIVAARSRGVSRSARSLIAVLWLVLVFGHYLAITAAALWGRELNFYWDLRFLPDVFSMLAHAAQRWIVIAAAGGAVAVIVGLYWLIRRAIDVLSDSVARPAPRRALTVGVLAALALFVAERFGFVHAQPSVFPQPVTAMYAHQLTLTADAIRGSRSLPPSPSFDADLARAGDADVLVFFLESYGAVAFEQQEINAPLEPHRQHLQEAIAATGRDVVSAYVASPTFGGSSWFAHITLLSGLDVDNPDTNVRLLSEQRDTLAKMFGRHGYKTVALLPAIWSPWPEGKFYGFDEIYDGPRLHYTGPQFGWFDMSDQYVLAKLDAMELTPSPRKPVFVVFPTVTTHTPFSPTPPYQPDWSRMLTKDPYAQPDVDRAYETTPDWENLRPSYVNAVSYAYETLAGYLRQHTGRDFVLVLLGDHQPPALVSGEGAPWDVPVHVITNRQDILERLTASGFRRGLTPTRPSLGKMSSLTPLLLNALSSGER
jgi:hypothetical protein